MDISHKYCFIVGTSRGTLASTYCTKNERILHYPSEQISEITALEWGRNSNEVIVGYKCGNVYLYNYMYNQYTRALNNLEGNGSIIGVDCVNKSILIGKYDGIVNIWAKNGSDFFSTNLDEKSSLDCMLLQKIRKNVIGTGGGFNDFKLWDIDSKQCIFKAKSLGHDELNLPIRTSVKAIAYLSEPHLSLVATKEGHILLYDDHAQRKPVAKFFEKKCSYTSITNAYRERQCLVGTTKGYMQLLDMRVPGKCLTTFSSFTGSVTSIVCDPFEPIVAASSLDRFLRVYNFETKELISKTYLKQNLTKLLMKPLVKVEENADINMDKEYEELFDNMETVCEKKIKKRKFFVNNQIQNKKRN